MSHHFLKAMLMALAFLVVCDARRCLQSNICENGTPTYTFYAIDGKVDPKLSSCTFSLVLASGPCMLDVSAVKSDSSGRICFASSSPACASFNSASLTGTVTANCAGETQIKSIQEITNVKLDQEIKITSSLLNGSVAIGHGCQGATSVPTWKPRNCSTNTSGESQPSGNTTQTRNTTEPVKNDTKPANTTTGQDKNTTQQTNNTSGPSTNGTQQTNQTTGPQTNQTTTPPKNTTGSSNTTTGTTNHTAGPTNQTTGQTNNTSAPKNQTTDSTKNTTKPSNTTGSTTNTTKPQNQTTGPTNHTTGPQNQTTQPSHNTTGPSNQTQPSNNTKPSNQTIGQNNTESLPDNTVDGKNKTEVNDYRTTSFSFELKVSLLVFLMSILIWL